MKRYFVHGVASTLVPRCLVAAAALALTTGVELQAQGLAAARRDTITLGGTPIRIGKRVRLHIAGDGQLEGRLAQLSDGAEGRLLLTGSSRPIELASVDSIWVRESEAATAAAVGGFVAGFAAVYLLTQVCAGLSDSGGCGNGGGVLLLSLPIAGLAVLLGHAMGDSNWRWRLAYVRAR